MLTNAAYIRYAAVTKDAEQVIVDSDAAVGEFLRHQRNSSLSISPRSDINDVSHHSGLRDRGYHDGGRYRGYRDADRCRGYHGVGRCRGYHGHGS